MFKSEVKGGGWTILRIILAIVTLVLFFYQIYFAGQWITERNHEGREISLSDYENLTNGEMVNGKLKNIVVGDIYGEDSKGNRLSYYLVKTNNKKLLTFRTISGSRCEKDILNVLSGKSEEVHFIGYVKPMIQRDSSDLSLASLADNTLQKLGISEGFDDVLIKQVVDISEYQEYSDTTIFIASIVGGLFMLFLTFMLLKKPIKNAAYCIGVAKGKITPYMPEIDFVQHKKEFEKYERIDPNNTESVDYYDGYEKDSIDFTEEKKHWTIYGEEYRHPTLEKNIQTYEDYKYDSLDFAQEEVDKKNINEF